MTEGEKPLMKDQWIRHDIEGDLFQRVDEDRSWPVKRLSLETAWYCSSFEDLKDYLSTQIANVLVNQSDRFIEIHYLEATQPLDLESLRAILQPEQPLGVWRLAVFANAIAEYLNECHLAGLSQLIIHPERIGLCKGRFVLMPSLACVLPPISQLPSNQVAGWMHYIAPEALRTRAVEGDLLRQADLFSFGRLLLALSNESWSPAAGQQAPELAARIVEGAQTQSGRTHAIPPGANPELAPIIQIAQRLCAYLPEDRLSLDDALDSFCMLASSTAPETVIAALIAGKQINQAKACMQALEESQEYEVYQVSPAQINVLRGDLALALSPPNYVVAIDNFRRAQQQDPRNAELYLRIAQTYAQYTKHPQHLNFSSDAYLHAARLLNWPTDILQTWFGILAQLNEPKVILNQTQAIPWDHRIRLIFLLRARSQLALEEYFLAWTEMVNCFERFGFHPEAYELARQAASQIDPVALIRWMHEHGEVPGSEAALAIVWERNGNIELAREKFNQAISADNSTLTPD